MSIKIDVPAPMQPLTDNLTTVEVNGGTVGECLSNLVKQFPIIAEMLFTTDGRLLGYIGVYVNQELTQSDELAKPVRDGDEIYLPYITTGG